MTVREQLEAKYGKASSTTSVRQQLEAKYGKASTSPTLTNIQNKAVTPPIVKNESLADRIWSGLAKTGKIGGKVLDTAAKYSGIQSGVDLLATTAKAASYKINELTGNEKGNELLMKGMTTGVEQAIDKGGIAGGLKDVAGKTLEVATAAAPFAKGAQAVKLTGELATKFPNIARYASYGLQGAKYGGASGTAKSLQENDNLKGVVKDAFEGAATGALIGVAVPAVVEGTIRAAKNVFSLYSGVPKEALERAFNNPEEVGKAARKYAKDPEATQEILNKANESFNAIKKARSESYQNALAELQNSGYKSRADQEVISSGLDEVINKFNPKILSNNEVEKLNELRNLYANWDDFTPLGLEDLRKAIRNRVVIGNSKELNAVATQAENKLKDIINITDPRISEMRTNYANSSKFIDELQREIFGKTSKLSDSTKLNRLLSIFNQKSDTRTKLIEKLGKEVGQDLLNEITGATMSSWLPTGWVQRFVLGGIGGGAALSAGATAPLAVGALGASPRIVGKAARVLGQASKTTPLINKYGQMLANKIINK